MSKIQLRESRISGKGVFAAGDFSCGEVILWINDSRLLTDENPVREDLGENKEHCDWLPDGSTVLMQEPECFINHCCDPNVYVYSVNHKRYLLARRPIQVGEELLYDYAVNGINGDVWDCCCGAARCRGTHKCDFFELPISLQFKNLPYLDPWFVEVHKEKFVDLLDKGLFNK